jgi:NAD(P)-dependent dehydrogenase (short-subunit alcohol dehydrogenase family)/acyl carrier protein
VTGSRVDPAQAPLWGLGRVAAVELPEHWGGLVDLAPTAGDDDAGVEPATAGDLVAAIRSAGPEDQLAVRDGRVFVPRLTRRARTPAAAFACRRDATYLVTGGLGGLGLKIAPWLAAAGAGTIVLTGRHGLPDRARWDELDPTSRAGRQVAAVRASEALGATVVVVAADVADVRAMTDLIGRCGADLPPLAGVVHAAAALGTAGLAAMSAADVERMLRPKVAGTLLLHELTRSLPLDHFVLFSSTTALWGSRDLGHYAAANVFLDAMAHHRRSLGLAALSVDWGTWDEMRVASADDRDEVASSGLHPMPSDDALELLGELLGDPEVTQVAAAVVDWDVLKAVYEARRPRPFLAAVASAASGGRTRRSRRGEDGPPVLAVRLQGVAGDDRRGVVVEFLREEVARALGIAEPWSVDEEQGLFDMGMDSLMSVELKGRIEVAVGTNLPSTLTFNYPSIAALAGYVATEVLPEPARPGTGTLPIHETDGGPAPAAEAPTTTTDDLTEDELAAMLARRLAGLR